MRTKLMFILLIFVMTNSFSQKYPNLRLGLTQNENILILEFKNCSVDTLVFNRCFDFQTLGEFGKPDISILVKKRLEDDFFAPIASRYTKRFYDCYVKLIPGESFFLDINIDRYFRDNIWNAEIVECKLIVRTNLIKGGQLIPNYLIESSIFYLFYDKK